MASDSDGFLPVSCFCESQVINSSYTKLKGLIGLQLEKFAHNETGILITIFHIKILVSRRGI